jgi:hypothetical protein
VVVIIAPAQPSFLADDGWEPSQNGLRFGRRLADYASNPINLSSLSVTSLASLVNVYRVRKDYVLSEVTRDGVDTVGVWGSNPHAPTNALT